MIGTFDDDQTRLLPAYTVALHIEVFAQFSEDGLACKIYVLFEGGWDLELGVVWLGRRAGYGASIRVWPRICEKGLPPELECPVS